MKQFLVPPDNLRPDERSDQQWLSINGRVLSERFLVIDDLTDPAVGSGFSVYLVKDLREFCRKVILKSAPPPLDDLIDQGPSFPQVCEVLKGLDHPAIENIIETGKLFDGRSYALAGCHRGIRLSSVLEGGTRLELSRIARIIEQSADGISAAHRKGILHCDICPSNILLTDEKEPDDLRIMNFGSAWPIDSRGERLSTLDMESESIYYAAPELHSNLGHRSAASDIFSLAALAYRMITGNPPFTGTNRRTLVEAMSAGTFARPIELRTDVSLTTENLLLTALQFEPAWRPQNIEDFGYRLANSLRPVPKGIITAPVETAQAVEEPAVIESNVPVQLSGGDDIPFAAAPAIVTRSRASIVPDRTIAWALIILLLAGALSIPIAQNLFYESTTSAAVGTMLERPASESSRRQLKLWLERENGNAANRLRPTDLSVRPLTLNLTTDSSGYAYLFKEFADSNGGISYQVVHPEARATAAVEVGKPIGVSTLASEGINGLWVVWTAARNEDIESITASAADNAVVPEEEARKLRHFLERNRNLRLSVAEIDGQTILDGIGDRIVYRLETETAR